MALTPPYGGYLGEVWRTAYASLTWLSATMAAADNAPASVANPALVVYQTLRNAVDAVSAYMTAKAWQTEYSALQRVQVLPLSLDTTTAAYFNARIGAYNAAGVSLAAIIPTANPLGAAALLAQGLPAIADVGLLDFYANFNFETPPTALTAGGVFFPFVQASAIAWQTVAAAVSAVQGTTLGQEYDTATRQYEVAQLIADRINALESGPIIGMPTYLIDSEGYIIVDSSGNPIYDGGDTKGAWDEIVSMPCLTTDAAILTSAPYSAANQQSGVIRYALLETMKDLALLLLSLRQPTVTNADQATLMMNDSPLDFAARNTSDFENWTTIVSSNNLLPPWTGTAQAPYGSALFIPSPGSAAPTPGVAQPTYAANVMGTDFYIGPINGVMPPWTGDFQLVTGYNNLAISLGRRLQTPLGALIYHSDFGSRIPPEVGAVQDSSTAGHIAAYGQSALVSDPRVGVVLSATCSIQPGGAGLVSFNGLVQPIGQNSDAVTVNQVISPLA